MSNAQAIEEFTAWAHPRQDEQAPVDLMTIEGLADRAGISVDEVKGRLWSSYIDLDKDDDIDGRDEHGQPLVCWNRCHEWLKEEMLTVNAASEKWLIDRAAVKRKIGKGNVSRPLIEQRGKRTYKHYWLSELVGIFGEPPPSH